MSYNLRVDTVKDQDNSFNFRKEKIPEIIRKHNPDIIGFQEATAPMRFWLKENFPEYNILGCGRNRGFRREGIPVGFRKDKFDLISSNTFWLSATPEVPAQDFLRIKANVPRIYHDVRLKVTDTGRPFSDF